MQEWAQKEDQQKRDEEKLKTDGKPSKPGMGSSSKGSAAKKRCLSFFFTLVTGPKGPKGPRRSLSLKLSDSRVYEPQIRACGRPRDDDSDDDRPRKGSKPSPSKHSKSSSKHAPPPKKNGLGSKKR